MYKSSYFVAFALLGCFLGCGQQNPTSNSLDINVKPVSSNLVATPLDLVDVPLKVIYRMKLSASYPYNYLNQTWTDVPTGYQLNRKTWMTLDENNPKQLAGVIPIYELYGNVNNIGDHMPSTSTSEGLFTLAWPLGMAFNSSTPSSAISALGLSKMNRYNYLYDNSTHMDHLLSTLGETPPSGYALESSLGYAWPITLSGTLSLSTTVSATNSTPVTLSVDKAYGGAISSLTVDGVEYINSMEAGRLAQTAMWIDDYCDNPTEAGDMIGNISPLISFNSSATSITTKVLALSFTGYANRSVYTCPGTTGLNPAWKNTNSGVAYMPQQPLLTGTTMSKTITSPSPGIFKVLVTITASKSAPASVNSIFPEVDPLGMLLNGGLFSLVNVAHYANGSWNNDNLMYQKNGVWTQFASTNVTAYSLNPSDLSEKTQFKCTDAINNTSNLLVTAQNLATGKAIGLYSADPVTAGYRGCGIWPVGTTSTTPIAPKGNETLLIGQGFRQIPITAGVPLVYTNYIIVGTNTADIRARLKTYLISIGAL